MKGSGYGSSPPHNGGGLRGFRLDGVGPVRSNEGAEQGTANWGEFPQGLQPMPTPPPHRNSIQQTYYSQNTGQPMPQRGSQQQFDDSHNSPHRRPSYQQQFVGRQGSPHRMSSQQQFDDSHGLPHRMSPQQQFDEHQVLPHRMSPQQFEERQVLPHRMSSQQQFDDSHGLPMHRSSQQFDDNQVLPRRMSPQQQFDDSHGLPRHRSSQQFDDNQVLPHRMSPQQPQSRLFHLDTPNLYSNAISPHVESFLEDDEIYLNTGEPYGAFLEPVDNPYNRSERVEEANRELFGRPMSRSRRTNIRVTIWEANNEYYDLPPVENPVVLPTDEVVAHDLFQPSGSERIRSPSPPQTPPYEEDNQQHHHRHQPRGTRTRDSLTKMR